MRYEIETYKGQTIEYDDDYDKFICDITIEDKFKNTKRSSLKDVRKEIDSFIKLNAEFKPFKAIFKSEYNNKDFYVATVESIRTDGKFVVSTNGSSYKSHYNMKDMQKCMEYNEDIIKEKERLEDELKFMQTKTYNKINDLSSRLVKIDLSQYDKFISQAAV